MKIAIVHNLHKGGALNLLISVAKSFHSRNTIDIYSLNYSKTKLLKKVSTNLECYKLPETNNIIGHLIQIFGDLKRINKIIAQKINSKNYDLVMVFPCVLTQSPYILKFLNKNVKTIYLFTEPKREFYEKTSFDYFSLKKLITRIIRIPIKLVDINNCKYAQNIITISCYEQNLLKTLYNKNSRVIYPELEEITPTIKKLKNNHKFLSVGAISKIKGHSYSIDLLSNISKEMTILGRETEDSKYLYNYAKRKKIKINLIKSENNKFKNNIFKNYSFYLANQEREPFGISTLEATSSGCFLLGRNIGGTPEIIKHGLNGLLLPENIKKSKTIIKKLINKKYLNLYKTCKINENATASKILKVYHYLWP